MSIALLCFTLCWGGRREEDKEGGGWGDKEGGGWGDKEGGGWGDKEGGEWGDKEGGGWGGGERREGVFVQSPFHPR